MNAYGQTALRASALYMLGGYASPLGAWVEAAQELFPGKPSSQRKGCPKDAFLGLCEEGLVKGIPKGCYCNSFKNKGYALDAIALLKHDPRAAQDPERLWTLVMRGERKVHNSQMDVVTALWNASLINNP
jgi:hypothetical protein